MLTELRPALALLLVLTVLTGLAYPLGLTLLAQLTFPWQAQGSLIEKNGQILGSTRIGQAFTSPLYFWGRPSATTAPDPNDPTQTIPAPYNAASSSGSNAAPSSLALVERITQSAEALRAAHPDRHDPVPIDLVTTSASGLDPDLTPAGALWQVERVAKARGVPVESVRALVTRHIEGRLFGLIGEPRVNVLALNLALDETWPRPQ